MNAALNNLFEEWAWKHWDNLEAHKEDEFLNDLRESHFFALANVMEENRDNDSKGDAIKDLQSA